MDCAAAIDSMTVRAGGSAAVAGVEGTLRTPGSLLQVQQRGGDGKDVIGLCDVKFE